MRKKNIYKLTNRWQDMFLIEGGIAMHGNRWQLEVHAAVYFCSCMHYMWQLYTAHPVQFNSVLPVWMHSSL